MLVIVFFNVCYCSWCLLDDMARDFIFKPAEVCCLVFRLTESYLIDGTTSNLVLWSFAQ